MLTKRIGQTVAIIDTDRPHVMIKHDGRYGRGELVYPIALEGGVPGSHHWEGYITVSTADGRAGFYGEEKGFEVISLDELVEVAGTAAGVTRDENRYKKGRVPIEGRKALTLLLDQYALLQLPEDARDSTVLSRVSSTEPFQNESGIILDSLT